MTVKVFGKSAEWAANVKKGDTVTVQGSIKNEQWQDKDGNKKTSTYIHVSPFDKFINFSELGRHAGKKSDIPQKVAANTDDDLPF